jgi:PAS domain S-box-containing protein/putative nucleotidyltransferase with HDIG domain
MIETPEEGFLSGNPAALEMFGCRDNKEFIFQNLASLSPEYQPDGTLSSEKAQQNNDIAMKEGSHYFEWVHKRMDGQEFPSNVLLTRMELQGREILHATVRDITESKRIEQAIILMSDTQRQIANQEKLVDIYQLVGKKIQELIGDGYVITTMYDEQIEAMKVITVNGFGDRFENLVRKLKTDPFKPVIYLKDMSANHLRSYRSGKLEKYEGALYDLFTRKVPKQICGILEKEFNATGIYVMGFSCKNLDFGGVTIFPKDDIAPFKDMIETIINQAAIAIRRIRSEEELLKSEQKLRGNLEGTIQTIALTVEVRDPYTAGHQTRVSDLAAVIAREMKLTDEQVEGVKMAGIIHDLGKIQLPAEILSKPGKLTELEFNLIKTHPQVGFDLLKTIEFPWPIAEMVHQHHERMDGSGYPQGLKGEKIMLEARILAVADVVEAMSSHRPYRPAHGIEKALNQIKQDKGTLLDPKVVDVCLKIFKGGYESPKS